MINVTAEFLQRAVQEGGCAFISHHLCGICDSPVGYVFLDDEPHFDGRCDCSSLGEPRLSTWEDVAQLFNSWPEATKLTWLCHSGISKETIAALDKPVE